jgi:hypothetical protein
MFSCNLAGRNQISCKWIGLFHEMLGLSPDFYLEISVPHLKFLLALRH